MNENTQERQEEITVIKNNDSYYTVECEDCGWIGSSQYAGGGGQIADTGDYSDPLCPVCWSNKIDEAEDQQPLSSYLPRLAKAHELIKHLGAEVDALRYPSPAAPAYPRWVKARIYEVIKEDGGCWRPCSGCHETSEGQETGHNSFSEVFQRYIGSGCHECGGIGVVWTPGDVLKPMESPSPEVNVAELAEKEYPLKDGDEDLPFHVSGVSSFQRSAFIAGYNAALKLK